MQSDTKHTLTLTALLQCPCSCTFHWSISSDERSLQGLEGVVHASRTWVIQDPILGLTHLLCMTAVDLVIYWLKTNPATVSSLWKALFILRKSSSHHVRIFFFCFSALSQLLLPCEVKQTTRMNWMRDFRFFQIVVFFLWSLRLTSSVSRDIKMPSSF